MIIELHLLQSFPVSNLNRDDVGQPKSVMFGGFRRARISSQCLKRSARGLFTQFGLDKTETAIRTKRLVASATNLLAERDNRRKLDETIGVVTAGVESLGFGVAKENRTEYLLFVGESAVSHLADYCESNWDQLATAASVRAKTKAKKKQDDSDDPAEPGAKATKTKPTDRETQAKARQILDAGRAADVALFGRMIADNKDFNVDAASQVAHAISTHTVANEFDYYTAIDDLMPNDESGADMIGTVDYNAACFYRYANLDLDLLARNLIDDGTDLPARAASAWINAFIHAVPSGKQNSMAARTMPDTMLAVVRERGAWNLANAFLKPSSGSDLMAASAGQLLRHFSDLRKFYGTNGIRGVMAASVGGNVTDLEGGTVASTLEDFVSGTLAAKG